MKIDLAASQGNGWALMGLAERIGKQLGMTTKEITSITTAMRSGDYNHLLSTMETSFSEITFEFENDPRDRTSS